MDQTVYIPFHQKVHPGLSVFTLNVNKEYIQNKDRSFSFATVTLVPDLFDPTTLEEHHTEEHNDPVEEKYDIEIITKKNMYNKTKRYVPFSQPLKVPDVLNYINQYAEDVKPNEHILPPYVFDWVHKDAIDMHAQDQFNFNRKKCLEYYGEPFKQDKHVMFLPEYMRSLDLDLNHFLFPTNRDIWKDIRIRFTVMPNVQCYFTNDSLFLALGFADDQASEGDHTLGFNYLNRKYVRKMTNVAENPPNKNPFVSNTIISAVPWQLYTRSVQFAFKSYANHLRHPSFLILDYSKCLEKAALDLNINLSIQYDETSNKMFFKFPDGDKVNIVVRVSPQFAYSLGYGHVRQITKHSLNLPQMPKVDVQNANQISRITTLDTGFVIVQYKHQIVAALEPHAGGYLTTKKDIENKWFSLSKFNATLEFNLKTFDESNRLMPLDWRSGGLVRGVLVGQV